MNNLIIPPPVNSYLSNIMVCAPDDTAIYGSGRALVFIKPIAENEPNDVQILANAHSSHITSVNINPDWRAGNKYAVTMSFTDFIVKIWDVETLQRKFAYKHVPLGNGESTAVAAAFSGQNRIISVTSEGTVTLRKYLTGESSSFQLTAPKNTPVEITCMSVCPHAMWMVAFGLKSGPVMVTDMRKPGKVLHFLRGHSSMVLSLVWCPAPVNVFPLKPHNKVVEKIQATDTDKTQTDTADKVKSSDALTSPELSNDKKRNRRKQGNPKKEPCYWMETRFSPDIEEKNVSGLPDKKKMSKTKTLAGFLDKKNISKTPSLTDWLSSQSTTSSFDNTVDLQGTKVESDLVQGATNIASTLDSSKDTAGSSTNTSAGEAVLDVSCNSGSSQDSSSNGAATPEHTAKNTSGGVLVLDKDTAMDVTCNPDDSPGPSVNGAVTPENTTKDTATGSEDLSGDEMVLEKDYIVDVAHSRDDLQEPSSNGAAAPENTTKNTCGGGMVLEKDTTMDVTSNPDGGIPTGGAPENTTVGSEDPSGGQMVVEKDTIVDVAHNPDDLRGPSVNGAVAAENTSKNHFGSELIMDVSNNSGGSEDPSVNEAKEKTAVDVANDNAGNSQGPSIDVREPEVENWRTRKPIVEEEEQPRREFLLASSARESNIYIWRAGTDGRLQTFLTLPKHNKRHAGKKQTKSNEKEWIVLCWVTPNLLLSSTYNAELAEWKLPKPLADEKYPYIVHKQHNGFLYTISSPMVYLNEYNFLQKRTVNVWTTGKDRTILNTDLFTRMVLTRYPGWGGYMNLIVGSPLDPNRLAMAMSKSYHFFTWSLDQPHTKDIKFTANSVNKGVVTTLAWHPDIETLLAWGTEDGVVGTFDVSRKLKNPKEMKRYFSTPVHKVQWGPVDSTMKNRKLFTVCDGKVVVFDPFTDKKDSIKTELDLEISVYTMGWKPDYSMLLVSGKNGEVLELNPDLEVTSKKYTPEVVQTINWHPHAVSGDQTTSKYYKMFVSIIKHTKLYVFDLSIEDEFYKNKMIKSYDNKEVKINDVAWNPHVGNQLVMVDNHGIAWVYDIDGPVVATYINPYVDAISSVIWSPLDPDYVIVATYSNLMIWKVSENPPLTPEAVQSQRSKLETKQRKEANHLKPKDEEQLTDNKVKSKSQNYLVLPKFYPYKKNVTMSDIRLLADWKLGKMSATSETDASDILQIFGDLGNAKDIYKSSESYFQSSGDRNKLNLLRLFRGDLTEIIREAIEKKLVTPWIITIAPMASPQAYLDVCKTYVDQLEMEPNADPLEVTTYMLVTHQYQRCINYLCERQLFREALVLAKDKFGPSDPVVEEILRKYANMCTFGGNFELAACCYIALGDFHKAASVLYRRDDLLILKMARDLAALTSDEELYSAVNLRYLDAELKEKEKIAAKPDNIPEEVPTTTTNGIAANILLNCKKEMLGPDVQTSMYAHLLAEMENGDPKSEAEQVKEDIMEKRVANLEGNPTGLSDGDKIEKQENGDAIEDIVRKLDKMALSEIEKESQQVEKPESKQNDVNNCETKEVCVEKHEPKTACESEKSEADNDKNIIDFEAPSFKKSGEKIENNEEKMGTDTIENVAEESKNVDANLEIQPSSPETNDDHLRTS